MSGSNRGEGTKALVGYIVAAITVVGLYWAMFYNAGYQSGRNQERAQIERKHYAADTSERVERECAGETPIGLRECISEIVASEHENKRSESDLAAQWQAADWMFWASIIAGAQLAATIIGLYFIKGTLDATFEAVQETGKATLAMQETNEIARETMQKQLRAYIGVIIVEHPVLSENGTIFAKMKFTNYGQTPAHGCVFEGAFMLAEYPNPPLPELDFRQDGSKSSIFPGQEWTSHITLPHTLGPVLADVLDGQATRLYLYGELRYEDVFKTAHTLKYRYEMGGELARVGRLGPSPQGNEAT